MSQIDPENDPRLKVMEDIRAFVKTSESIFSTLYGLEACRMLLSGSSPSDVCAELAKVGTWSSISSLKTLKNKTATFPKELVDRILACETVLPMRDRSYFETLRDTMESVGRRAQEIEKEIRDARGTKQVVSEKRDDQLLKYYEKFAELRKQLEDQRLKSEVVQAYKRGLVEMAMMAMEMLSDDGQKAKLLEKVRDFERANL